MADSKLRIIISVKDRASGPMGRISRSLGGMKRAAGTLAKVGLGGLAAGFGVATAAGILTAKTAISVESAFAGVAKTTDGLVDDFGKLTDVGKDIRDGFRDLAKEVPLAVEELMAIGELAGQLGVPREALVEFSETVAALGVSTNLTTEEAATALARLGNIYQISSEDMAKNTEQIGSTIVALGNNFATTERDILAFGERMAGAGKIAGLSQDEVLAIGTAMASVGIEADAGGTAVQKVLLAMTEAASVGGEELEKFAAATGLTTKEFADGMKSGQGISLFSDFIFELGEAGDDAIGVLNELGLEDQRLVRAFLSLAGAGDLLDRTIETASGAFEENTALSEEARKRYQTTEAQLQILKNTFKDVGITIGDALLPFINEAITRLKPFIEQIGKTLPQIIERFVLPALEDLGEFIGKLPGLLEEARGFLQPIIEGAQNLFAAFQESAPEAQAAVQEFLTWFQENMIPVVMDVRDNVAGILDSLAELWREHGDKVIGFIEHFAETVSVVLGGFALLTTGTFRALLMGLQGDWDGALEFMKEQFENWVRAVLSLVDVTLEEFIASWQGVADLLEIIVNTLGQRLEDAVHSWRNSISNLVSDAIEVLRPALQLLQLVGGPNLAPILVNPLENTPSRAHAEASKTNNFDLTINSQAESEDIVGQFEMMKAIMAGAN